MLRLRGILTELLSTQSFLWVWLCQNPAAGPEGGGLWGCPCSRLLAEGGAGKALGIQLCSEVFRCKWKYVFVAGKGCWVVNSCSLWHRRWACGACGPPGREAAAVPCWCCGWILLCLQLCNATTPPAVLQGSPVLNHPTGLSVPA